MTAHACFPRYTQFAAAKKDRATLKDDFLNIFRTAADNPCGDPYDREQGDDGEKDPLHIKLLGFMPRQDSFVSFFGVGESLSTAV